MPSDIFLAFFSGSFGLVLLFLITGLAFNYVINMEMYSMVTWWLYVNFMAKLSHNWFVWNCYLCFCVFFSCGESWMPVELEGARTVEMIARVIRFIIHQTMTQLIRSELLFVFLRIFFMWWILDAWSWGRGTFQRGNVHILHLKNTIYKSACIIYYRCLFFCYFRLY